MDGKVYDMSANPDEILTGEGVSLQVQAASVIARAGAWLIDAIVTVLLLLGLLGVLSYFSQRYVRMDEAMGMALTLGAMAFTFLVVPIIVETLTSGRSLGKLVFGLRIIRDDGGPVRLRHAMIRALVGFFELWLTSGSVAFIVSMLNDKGKRAGDFLAGTYSASMRGAKSQRLYLTMPPELAAWLAVGDLRPLPDALALQARQFLQRASDFPPPVRHRLGLRIAAQLERYVAPAAPPGTHPERFIMAVLYERRRRDQQAADAAAPRLGAQLAGIDTLPFRVPDPES